MRDLYEINIGEKSRSWQQFLTKEFATMAEEAFRIILTTDAPNQNFRQWFLEYFQVSTPFVFIFSPLLFTKRIINLLCRISCGREKSSIHPKMQIKSSAYNKKCNLFKQKITYAANTAKLSFVSKHLIWVFECQSSADLVWVKIQWIQQKVSDFWIIFSSRWIEFWHFLIGFWGYLFIREN